MPISVPSFRRFLITAWLGVILFTTACGSPPVDIAVQPQPTCMTATTEANPYATHSQDGVVKIYEYFKTGSITYDNARQAAISQLGINTGRWSDYVDITLDGSNMVRIVVTYLDPALMQYVILNHILADSNNLMELDKFRNEMMERMNKLGGRNEMLFVVTITTLFYWEQSFNGTVLTVDIPIEEMTLISASDVRVAPTHEDHILDERIDISHGPVFGIVGYPFAVMNGDQCTWIIDQWTNSLTLDVPRVILGGTDVGPQFWNIPYRPLVMEVDNQSPATYDPNYDWSRLNKIEVPPTPNWQPNAQFDNTIWKTYWEDMGRFIWNVVITESHH